MERLPSALDRFALWVAARAAVRQRGVFFFSFLNGTIVRCICKSGLLRVLFINIAARLYCHSPSLTQLRVVRMAISWMWPCPHGHSLDGTHAATCCVCTAIARM